MLAVTTSGLSVVAACLVESPPSLKYSVTWSVMGPPMAWLLGLFVVLVPVSAVVLARRP